MRDQTIESRALDFVTEALSCDAYSQANLVLTLLADRIGSPQYRAIAERIERLANQIELDSNEAMEIVDAINAESEND